MKTRRISLAEALSIARKKRPIVLPNSGFLLQLGVWGVCEYDIWHDVNGSVVEKPEYKKMRLEIDERAKEKVSDFDADTDN